MSQHDNSGELRDTTTRQGNGPGHGATSPPGQDAVLPRQGRRRLRQVLLVLSVAVLVLAGAGLWLLGTTAGTGFLLARVAVPGELRYAEVEGSLLGGLVLHDPGWEDDGTAVTMERLELSIRPGAGLRGIVITDLRLVDVRLVLPEDEGGAGEPVDIAALLPDLAAPLPITLERGLIEGLSLAREAGADWLLLERAEARLRWDDALRDIAITAGAPGVDATLSGSLALRAGTTQLEVRVTTDGGQWHPDLPDDIVTVVMLNGSLERADLRLNSETMGLEVVGQVDALLADPQFRADLALARWAPTVLAGEGVELVAVEGRVVASMQDAELVLDGEAVLPELGALTWDVAGSLAPDAIMLETLTLRTNDAVLTAGGRVALDTDPELDLALNWSGLSWPLDGEPVVRSETGQGRLQGVPDRWRFDGAFKLETPGYPGGALNLLAEGDREQAESVVLSGELLGGSLSADGAVGWSGDLSATANFDIRDLDLGALFPDWPLQLAARGELALSAGETPAVTVDLASIGGRFQGEDLGGKGRIDWQGDQVSLQGVRLALGPAWVEAEGRSAPGAMRFELDMSVGDRGWVARQLGGPLAGSVVLDSAARLPIVRADLVGGPLVHEDLRVERISLRREDSGERLQLDLAGIAGDDLQLDTLALALRRAAGGWRVDIESTAPPYRLTARLDGAPEATSTFTAPAFEGQLSALRVDDESGNLVSLRRPAPIAVDEEGGSLSRGCLAFGDGGTACIDATMRPGDTLDLALELDRLSLGALTAFADPPLTFTQRLTGTAGWRWIAGQPPRGEAAIEISAGQAGLVGEQTRLGTGAGFVGFEFDERALRNGRLDLPLDGGGQLSADFAIEDLQFDGSGRISGATRIDVPDLGVFAALAPALGTIEGRLSSSLGLGGTVADPAFDGAFDLSGARLTYPRLGAAVEDLSLRGRVDRSDRLTLRGQFRMGEGEGSLGVNAGFADLQQPELSIAITGESLAVARLPDLEVEANPNLALSWRDGSWNILGGLVIPRALVVPESSFVTRVDESEDVIVVAGERTPVIERQREEPIEFFGGLALTLGEDVRLEMDIASLRLTGDLDLAWNGLVMPGTTGELLVNGPVTVWGPRLLIERGRVRWDEAPLSNPTLDLRAERDVFGSSLVRTAGVRVSGTARRPDIEAYTRPLTNSDRAWTLLVTGSDVDFAEGVGAFDVGTYIAPRLFLSYGISLFDSENVVGLRYDLRRGWGVKVSSGQRESGVDLSYTIEQD